MAKIDLDSLSIEELAAMRDAATEKLAQKVAARQSELDELRREVAALRTGRPLDYAAQAMGATDIVSDIKGDLATANAALTAEPPSPEPPVAPDAPSPSPAAEADPKVPTT